MPQLYDPSAYRKRSTPIDSQQAQKNASAFADAVRKAMEEHHIADCMLVAEVNVIAPASDLVEEESEATYSVVIHIGDIYKSVPMAAYGHAFMRAEVDGIINSRKVQGAKRARELRG